MNNGEAPASPSPWAWVRRFVRPEAGAIAAILVLSALTTAVALTPPYLVKMLIDDAILARDATRLGPLIAALVGLAVLGAALSTLNGWLHTRTSGRILFPLRESLYAHLATLSPRTLARHREGDLLARLDGDVAEIQRFSLDSVLAVATGALALLATAALLVSLSPRLSLVALVLLPLEWLFLRWIRPHLAARTRALREHTSTLSSFFVETLPAIKAIQALGTQDRERERLARLHGGYLGDLLHSGLWNAGAAAGPRFVSAGAQAAVFGVGGLAAIRGELSLGSLMAFSAYLAQATRPVQTLFGIYAAVSRARVSLERVEALTRLAPEVKSPARPRPFPTSNAIAIGQLVLDDVGFGHPGGPALLDGASCTIAAGSRVLLTGSSGAGKSTLVDLVARHYDPERGAIYLDGINLRDLDLRALRRAVAVVGQGGVLFRGTIADNLRYGNWDASPSALREAAGLAELGELLDHRNEGLDTPVASGGAGLSGGEAQRVLLARAFLQRPRILVLDEATSEIDALSERKILDCVDHLFANTTRMVIQHHGQGRDREHKEWDLTLQVRDGALIASAGDTGARRHPG